MLLPEIHNLHWTKHLIKISGSHLATNRRLFWNLAVYHSKLFLFFLNLHPLDTKNPASIGEKYGRYTMPLCVRAYLCAKESLCRETGVEHCLYAEWQNTPNKRRTVRVHWVAKRKGVSRYPFAAHNFFPNHVSPVYKIWFIDFYCCHPLRIEALRESRTTCQLNLRATECLRTGAIPWFIWGDQLHRFTW